jgi:hypothetical protein
MVAIHVGFLVLELSRQILGRFNELESFFGAVYVMARGNQRQKIMRALVMP